MLLGAEYIELRRKLEAAFENRARGVPNLHVHVLADKFFRYAEDREFFIEQFREPAFDLEIEDPEHHIDVASAWISLETMARLEAMGLDPNMEVIIMPDYPVDNAPAPYKA